ncbi:MAG TPA: PEGA domain-containing protein [Candidatus Saccharimonadales bacterium]|nr:PEGA domain-containing protein [Candidatus Saccharimonadales bacterium]
MTLNILRYCVALFVFVTLGTASTSAQGIVEYGVITGTAAGAAASAKPLIPFPSIPIPGSPAAAAPAVSGTAGAAAMTPEAAAKANVQFFQAHAGPTAAEIVVRTVPDHASTWIDGKFVGPAPLNLKLAPGHHQILVRAISMHEYAQEFDLAAKQTQSIDVALKISVQNQVVIHWPSQK